MEEIEKLGRMRAVLSLEGVCCRPDEITQRLAIAPADGGRINDDSAKITSPEEEIYPSWIWSTAPKEYISTSEPLYALGEFFLPKLGVLQEVCKEMELSAHIKVMVHIFGGELSDPLLSVDSPSVLFANALSADIEIIMENWPDNLED